MIKIKNLNNLLNNKKLCKYIVVSSICVFIIGIILMIWGIININNSNGACKNDLCDNVVNYNNENEYIYITRVGNYLLTKKNGYLVITDDELKLDLQLTYLDKNFKLIGIIDTRVDDSYNETLTNILDESFNDGIYIVYSVDTENKLGRLYYFDDTNLTFTEYYLTDNSIDNFI